MSTMILPTDAIGLSEAAALIGVTGSTIRRWIQLGTLAGFRVGCHWRVSREDVLAQVRRAVATGPAVQTKAERRARDVEVDRVLREAGVRR